MEITIQWFWLIGFVVIVFETFLVWKWFRTKFSKKWGYILLVTFILTSVIGKMIKIEQITKRDFNTLQTQSIESHKKLPPKIKDNSFKKSVMSTKSINIDFINEKGDI